MESYTLAGVFLLLLGILLLCPAFCIMFKVIKSQSYVDIDATITSYKKILNLHGSATYVYKPCAEYVYDNKKYQVLSTYSSSSTKLLPRIGSQVKVKFNPDNPEDAVISPSLQFFQSVFVFLIAGILLYIGYVLLTNQIPDFLKPIIEML